VVTGNRLPRTQEKASRWVYSVGGNVKTSRLMAPTGVPACAQLWGLDEAIAWNLKELGYGAWRMGTNPSR
jgi:hypothetical protein